MKKVLSELKEKILRTGYQGIISVDDCVEIIEEKIKEIAEFEEGLKTVIETLANRKVEEPVLHFKYPEKIEKIEFKDFYKWFDEMEGYFCGIAKTFEQQERGFSCSVDRAWSNWIKPEVLKMWERMKK
jgi:hypothetical protein